MSSSNICLTAFPKQELILSVLSSENNKKNGISIILS